MGLFTGTKRNNEWTVDRLEIRKRVKVLVVDDDENSFPTKMLAEDGYTIEHYDSVDARRLERMERSEFDIIFLDIKGVAEKSISPTDGLGVLERIKSVNPLQIVIAFSNNKFDLDQSKFWKLTDDQMSKPISIISAKDALDRMIDKRLSPEQRFIEISHLLRSKGVKAKDIDKLEQSMKTGKSLEAPQITKLLEATKTGAETAMALVSLITRTSALFG